MCLTPIAYCRGCEFNAARANLLFRVSGMTIDEFLDSQHGCGQIYVYSTDEENVTFRCWFCRAAPLPPQYLQHDDEDETTHHHAG